MTSGWISGGLECRAETAAVDRNLEVTHIHIYVCMKWSCEGNWNFPERELNVSRTEIQERNVFSCLPEHRGERLVARLGQRVLSRKKRRSRQIPAWLGEVKTEGWPPAPAGAPVRRVWGTQLRAGACGGRAPTGLSEGRRETGCGRLEVGGRWEEERLGTFARTPAGGVWTKGGVPHLQSEPWNLAKPNTRSARGGGPAAKVPGLPPHPDSFLRGFSWSYILDRVTVTCEDSSGKKEFWNVPSCSQKPPTCKKWRFGLLDN